MEVQKLIQINQRDKIFATGVYLQAIEVEINGTKQWRWVAVGFEDDTYFNGKKIEIYDYANSFDELVINIESE